MLPENQTNKSPDETYNQTVPRSIANSELIWTSAAVRLQNQEFLHSPMLIPFL